MLGPLVALAIPSLLIGLVVGLPPDGGLIHRWLDKVFEAGPAVAGAVHEAAPSLTLTVAGFLVSTVLSLAGIWLAYAMYVTGQISPARVTQRFRDFYAIFSNKWYFDEIYHELIVAPLSWLSTVVIWKWIDVGFIDGIVNGIGWLFGGLAQQLRRVQTGVVSNYALAIALGTVIIVGVYLLWGPQFLPR